MDFGEFAGVCLLYIAGMTVFGYGLGISDATEAMRRSSKQTMLLGLGIMVLAASLAGILAFRLGGVVMAGLVFGNIPGAYCAWVAHEIARRRTTPAVQPVPTTRD